MKISINIVQSILFALILFTSFAFYKAAFAVTLNIDPSLPEQQQLTIECVYPIARTDGTALALNEIAQVNFYVTKDGARTAAGSNNTACRQVYDMSNVSDATYIYSVTALDTDNRESIDSPEVVTAIVKRLTNPNSPKGLTATIGSLP
jgi:hypothetical protein